MSATAASIEKSQNIASKLCFWVALTCAFLIIIIMKHFVTASIFIKLTLACPSGRGAQCRSPEASINPKEILVTNLDEKNCTWPDLKLMNTPGPTTGLVSVPGSGNTWVRHLLELSSGILTGSVYTDDEELKKGGFAGEGITNGSVIAVKDHEVFKRPYDRIRYVAIIRHPLHSGLSEFNRENTGDNHMGHANMSVFMRDYDPFTKWYMKEYEAFMNGLVKMKNHSADQLCILQYEKLVEDVVKELRPCMEFLGFHINEDLERCIRKDEEGKFHRKPRAANELHMIFTHLLNDEKLEEYHELYNGFLTKLGKATLMSNALD